MAEACAHEHLADPAPGKHLRVCLDCAHRVIECSLCSAMLVAGPDVGESGWIRTVTRDSTDTTTVYLCPSCQSDRR